MERIYELLIPPPDVEIGIGLPEPSSMEPTDYTAAFAIPVSQSEIDAFNALLAEDSNADWPASKLFLEGIRTMWTDVLDVSRTEFTDYTANEASEVIGFWDDQLDEEHGVVFCAPGTYVRIASFVVQSDVRSDNPMDEFSMPDSVDDAVALAVRVRDAELYGERPVVFVEDSNVPNTVL